MYLVVAVVSIYSICPHNSTAREWSPLVEYVEENGRSGDGSIGSGIAISSYTVPAAHSSGGGHDGALVVGERVSHICGIPRNVVSRWAYSLFSASGHCVPLAGFLPLQLPETTSASWSLILRRRNLSVWLVSAALVPHFFGLCVYILAIRLAFSSESLSCDCRSPLALSVRFRVMYEMRPAANSAAASVDRFGGCSSVL